MAVQGGHQFSNDTTNATIECMWFVARWARCLRWPGAHAPVGDNFFFASTISILISPEWVSLILHL